MSTFPLTLCFSGGIELLMYNVTSEMAALLLRDFFPFAQAITNSSDPDSVIRLHCVAPKNMTENGFFQATRIPSDPDIYIVEYCENQLEQLARTIRDIYLINLRRKGFNFFHAAMVAKHDQGVLFFGNKRAGKTTMMLEMARLQKFNLIANDKVAVSNFAPSICLGLPVKVGIRKSLFDCVSSEIGHFAFDGQRHFVSMSEIALAYGVSLMSEANANLIIYPKYQVSVTSAIIRPIAAKRQFDKFFEKGAYNLLALDESVNGSYLSAESLAFNQFAACLPAYELTYSDDNRDQAAAMVSELFEKL